MPDNGFLEMTSRIKNNSSIISMSLGFVQSLFENWDVDKWLLLNATTKEQKNQIEQRDITRQAILEKLYVPNYQLENV